MKKLLLIIVLFLPFIIKAQLCKDTNYIHIPNKVGKQIALDLNRLDSLIAVSKVCDKEVGLLNRKILFKDSIIGTMEQKEINYKTLIEKEKEKFKIVEEQNTELRTEIKKNKTKNTFIQIIGGAFITSLTYILIFK
jgi:hypothetical protein